jgi:hypothetical protein
LTKHESETDSVAHVLKMVRRDTRYVRQFLEECAAAEAAEAQQADLVGKPDGLGAFDDGVDKLADEATDGTEDYSKAVVLPWWLPTERVPPQYTGKSLAFEQRLVLLGSCEACHPCHLCVCVVMAR